MQRFTYGSGRGSATMAAVTPLPATARRHRYGLCNAAPGSGPPFHIGDHCINPTLQIN